MANIKSAKKRILVTKTKKANNVPKKSSMKTAVKAAVANPSKETVNEAYKRIDISKVIIFNYLQIVFDIILSLTFLKEPLFITDLLGFRLILGYLLYNTLNPLPKK